MDRQRKLFYALAVLAPVAQALTVAGCYYALEVSASQTERAIKDAKQCQEEFLERGQRYTPNSPRHAI